MDLQYSTAVVRLPNGRTEVVTRRTHYDPHVLAAALRARGAETLVVRHWTRAPKAPPTCVAIHKMGD